MSRLADETKPGIGRLVLGVGLSAVAVAIAISAWLAVRHRAGWTTGDTVAFTGLVATIVGGPILYVSQALVNEWFADRREHRRQAQLPDLGMSELDQWQALLRGAILDKRVRGLDSQLGQMVRPGPAFDVTVDSEPGLGAGNLGHPRVMIEGEKLPLEAIKAQWDSNPRRRLVVLGPAGYGKTVASLSLLAHINRAEGDRQVIAELFPLNDWYRWRVDTQNAPLHLDAWLVSQLVTTYGDLGLSRRIAVRLIREDRLIPIFDGLDEVPETMFRRECKQEIDAYAGVTGPFRSFVVTCRTADYESLRPDWVASDQQATLLGLEPDQIVAVLRERTVSNQEWTEVVRRLESGDRTLIWLLNSPLRLSIALQAFRADDSAKILLSSTRSEVEARLWDLFLQSGEGTFARADQQKLIGWLTTLAKGLTRSHRFRLQIEDFEAYDVGGWARLGDFRLWVRASISVVAALVWFFAVGDVVGHRGTGWFFGAAYIAFSLTLLILYRSQIAGPTRRLANLLGGVNITPWYLLILSGPGFLLWASWTLGLLDDRLVGSLVFGATAGALHFAASKRWFSWTAPVERRPGPYGVISAARRRGLLTLLLVGVVVTVAAGCALAPGLTLPTAARCGATIGLVTGLIFGLEAGLDFWLFFGWFRYSAAIAGRLPRRLPAFLEWSTSADRQWLRRVADSYEFRHRELLDHLASSD